MNNIHWFIQAMYKIQVSIMVLKLTHVAKHPPLSVICCHAWVGVKLLVSLEVIDGWFHLFMLWRNCLFFLLWVCHASDTERHVSLRISLSSDTSWQVSPIPHLSQPHCTLSSRCTFPSQVLAPMSSARFGQWCMAGLAGVTLQSLLLLSKIHGVRRRLDQSWSCPLDCCP